jgi:anaerobic selenocysteine-containing dehydrogenase
MPEKWVPHAEGNFGTASGKCLFFNSDIVPPLPDYVPVVYDQTLRDKYPLQLLTIKTPKNFLNSSHANIDYLISKEGKPYLEINEQDATSRNIADGEELKVVNQRGRVFLTARISKKVKPGTVCMPQGFWPSKMKGGSSANALTDDRLTDMGRGGAMQEVWVEVLKV